MAFPVIKDGKTWQPKGKNFATREEVHYKWNPETLKVEKVIINPEEDIQKGDSLSLENLAKNGIKPVLTEKKGFQGDMRIFKDSNIHNDFKAAFTEIVNDEMEPVKDPIQKVEETVKEETKTEETK